MVSAISSQDIGTWRVQGNPPHLPGWFQLRQRQGRPQQLCSQGRYFRVDSFHCGLAGTGSPGERIRRAGRRFPSQQLISEGQSWPCNSNQPVCTGCGSVDGAGAGTFSFTIPNWPSAGTQELRVFGINGVKASKNFVVVGPQISVTPQTVVANQRVSLIGTGFSPGAVIANAQDDQSGTESS